MTALQPSDIPSSATTSLERLIAWAVLALNRVNPDGEAIEEPGVTIRTSQVGVVIDNFGNPRLIGRVSIELESDYASNSATKLWAKAKELSQVTLPVNYTTD